MDYVLQRQTTSRQNYVSMKIQMTVIFTGTMRMTNKKTYDEVVAENKELKEKLGRIQAQAKCGRCNGTGEIWTYWSGDIHCPVCSGTGRT
jgi:hypothetical protein